MKDTISPSITLLLLRSIMELENENLGAGKESNNKILIEREKQNQNIYLNWCQNALNLYLKRSTFI